MCVSFAHPARRLITGVYQYKPVTKWGADTLEPIHKNLYMPSGSVPGTLPHGHECHINCVIGQVVEGESLEDVRRAKMETVAAVSRTR